MKYWCYTYDQDKESFIYSEQDQDASLSKTEVLVKPIIVGVCGSDLKQIISKESTPRIGHEWVGFIEATGEAVTSFERGEKVISLAHVACEECDFCRDSQFSKCSNRQLLGAQNKSVISSFIKLQESDLLKVPQTLTYEDLALFEVAFIGDSAYNKALLIGLQQRDKCIVFGAGPIGIFTALSLHLRGHDVTVVELKENRLKIARDLGLKSFHYAKVLLNKDLHNSFNAVFDCTGDNHGPGAIKVLPAMAKTNGAVIIVGKYSNAHLEELHYSGKSLKVTWVANHEKKIFEETIKFWSEQISKFTSIVSKLYQVNDIDNAFTDALEAKSLKNLIQINKYENS